MDNLSKELFSAFKDKLCTIGTMFFASASGLFWDIILVRFAISLDYEISFQRYNFLYTRVYRPSLIYTLMKFLHLSQFFCIYFWFMHYSVDHFLFLFKANSHERSLLQSKFGVVPSSNTISILLKRRSKTNVKIGFTPDDDKLKTSLMVIR